MPPRAVVYFAPILESRMPPKKWPTTVKVPIIVAAFATTSASQPFTADSGVTKMEGAFTIPAANMMIRARIRIPERFTRPWPMIWFAMNVIPP